MINLISTLIQKIFNTKKEIAKDIFQDKDLLELFREENFDNCIIFYTVDTHIHIQHLIGYQNYPTQESINHNISELEYDDDFKLPSKILKKLQYLIYTDILQGT